MHNNLNILLVEDTKQIRDSLCEMFGWEFPEATVHAVSTAEEALEIWMTNRFDLVISDYNLPGMNGSQMVALMRENGEHNAHQKVVFISANPDAVTALIEAGNTAMKKPFTIPQFLGVLNKVLSE